MSKHLGKLRFSDECTVENDMLVPYCYLRKQKINIVSHPINSSNNMNTVVQEIFVYNNFHILIFQVK